MDIVLVRNRNGQVCATIHQGEKITKSVRKSVHMLRKPMGWSFDVEILQEALERGASVAEVIDSETQIAYTALISDFWKSGVLFDRGHGQQRVLPISRWTVHDPSLPMQQSFFDLVD